MKNNTLLMDFGTPTGSLEIIDYAFFQVKNFIMEIACVLVNTSIDSTAVCNVSKP
jgi:hypothetical protein